MNGNELLKLHRLWLIIKGLSGMRSKGETMLFN